ncbi:hypothetical protein ACSVDE_14530 [Pseudalkalibacillus sp. Hm43]|uniref:hypothetical protein n=1 Tax=Pseudalkalibacillus sp. Hm43 TaxID=3450742 RepID=UPI003F4359F2
MKKLITIIGLLMILLVGCSPTSSQETEEKNAEEKKEETETTSENESASDEETQTSDSENGEQEDQDSSEKDKEETKEESRVKNLRPSTGMLKVFQQTGGYTLKEKIIATNGQYVQRLLILGDMKTMQVLKWDSSEIKRIYEQSNPSNEDENILDTFKPIDNTEILLSESKTGKGDQSDWQIIEENVETKTPFQTFKDTIVVQRTFMEGENETIHTMYYAPEFGMVKEIYNVTGDNGYKVETQLESVETN